MLNLGPIFVIATCHCYFDACAQTMGRCYNCYSTLLSAIAKNELKKNLLCRNIRPITFILHIKFDTVHVITYFSIFNLYFPMRILFVQRHL